MHQALAQAGGAFGAAVGLVDAPDRGQAPRRAGTGDAGHHQLAGALDGDADQVRRMSGHDQRHVEFD